MSGQIVPARLGVYGPKRWETTRNESLNGPPFAGGPERPTVSDLANVLSWARDEAELVTELQAGSDTAFDWLVLHYHAPVYNLVLGMLGDVSDAADTAQEVFLKVFRGIHQFRRGSSLKTWLYRIAIREALNQRRWFWRHHRNQTSLDEERPDGTAAFELEDLGATPIELLESHEVREIVQRALAQVPEVFRTALILRDLEGFTYEEISEVLDVNVGTVKSRILRGRRILREILEPLLAPSRNPSAVELAPRRDSESAVSPCGITIEPHPAQRGGVVRQMAHRPLERSLQNRPSGTKSVKEGAR